MKELEQWQLLGAQFLSHNYHALLADAPGLGKTLQAIEAAKFRNLPSLLVICPASVRTNWREELNGQRFRGNFYVMSYEGAWGESGDAIRRYVRRVDAIVLDECHFLKNVDTRRTQAIFGERGLARLAKYKWCLSGTPVPNRPREFYSILKALHPSFANISKNAYEQRYCGAFWNGFGMTAKGATNTAELAEKIGRFMLRRTKKDVYPNRVAPLVSTFPLELTKEDLRPVIEEEQNMSNREAYLSPVQELFAGLGDLERLLRLTGEAKIRATSEYLLDRLETLPKIVVFYRHRSVGSGLLKRLSEKGVKCSEYHGGMSDGQKQGALKDFQGEARVFLGQIQAAGTGINGLQEGCSDVVFAEQDWTPGVMKQAIDRLDRIGQRSEFVSATILHAPGTLESAVMKVREGKEKVIQKLVKE